MENTATKVRYPVPTRFTCGGSSNWQKAGLDSKHYNAMIRKAAIFNLNCDLKNGLITEAEYKGRMIEVKKFGYLPIARSSAS